MKTAAVLFFIFALASAQSDGQQPTVINEVPQVAPQQQEPRRLTTKEPITFADGLTIPKAYTITVVWDPVRALFLADSAQFKTRDYFAEAFSNGRRPVATVYTIKPSSLFERANPHLNPADGNGRHPYVDPEVEAEARLQAQMANSGSTQAALDAQFAAWQQTQLLQDISDQLNNK